MTPEEILMTGIAIMEQRPAMATRTNTYNMWLAAVLTRQNEEAAKAAKAPRIRLFRWPDGRHWYASVYGQEVVENGVCKWNTEQEAEDAAIRFLGDNH